MMLYNRNKNKSVKQLYPIKSKKAKYLYRHFSTKKYTNDSVHEKIPGVITNTSD